MEERMDSGQEMQSLRAYFVRNPRGAVAFSGGVDSAFLLWAAVTAGAEVTAYYVRTPFQPEFEYQDALKLADLLGVTLRTVEVDVLEDPVIRENPRNRCYYCKRKLFTAICREAEKDGFRLILDGTNASDQAPDRPGMQALTELGVRSPLRECGLTKGEIRRLSKEAGLFTHDKPAYACLATRIPTGQPITREALERTERSEEYLRELGFVDFRVRTLGDHARIQLREEQIPLLMAHREEVWEKLKKDYSGILLDLEVRGG